MVMVVIVILLIVISPLTVVELVVIGPEKDTAGQDCWQVATKKKKTINKFVNRFIIRSYLPTSSKTNHELDPAIGYTVSALGPPSFRRYNWYRCEFVSPGESVITSPPPA